MQESVPTFAVVIVGIIILGALGSLAFLAFVPEAPQSPGAQGSQQSTASWRTVSTGSTDSGDVQLELTPKGVVNGQLVVSVAANTHSVALDDFDLIKQAVLLFDKERISPVSAPSFSAHHGSGELRFPITNLPDSFSIVITGIPAVPERVHSWS